MEIIRGFANLPRITLSTAGRDDDVFIDRLNYKYTTLILFVSSLTITVKILQADHIQCWVPAILAKYEHYINVYCWISNTYYVSYKEQTTSVTDKPERTVKYYQWVPMILLCLAFFFLLPRFFYRCLSKQSGLDMLNLADAAINYMSVEKFDKRRRSLLYLANSIHFYSITNKNKRAKDGFTSSSGASLSGQVGSPISGSSGSKPYLYNLICCHGKMNGAYLITLFMLSKVFYTLNSIGQLFVMNIFLGFNFNSHGFHVLRDLTNGLMSNTNTLNAQRRAQADTAAEEFAAQMNIHHPDVNNDDHQTSSKKSGGQGIFGGLPGKKFMGPTVVFDQTVADDDVFHFGLNNQGGVGGFGSPTVVSESIYSEPGSQSYTSMHRYFPRESACDFRIRANIDSLVHNYTVQCVLPINLYNEQLFILLWAWMWLVCLANCYDIVLWVYRLLPSSRYNYVRSRIRLRHSEASLKRSMGSFVYDYLSFDGVFVLRIMSSSMSDCVTHELLQTLWQNYTEISRSAGPGGGPGGGGGTRGDSNMMMGGGAGGGNHGGGMGGNAKSARFNQRYSMQNQQHQQDNADHQKFNYENSENI